MHKDPDVCLQCRLSLQFVLLPQLSLQILKRFLQLFHKNAVIRRLGPTYVLDGHGGRGCSYVQKSSVLSFPMRSDVGRRLLYHNMDPDVVQRCASERWTTWEIAFCAIAEIEHHLHGMVSSTHRRIVFMVGTEPMRILMFSTRENPGSAGPREYWRPRSRCVGDRPRPC